MSDLNPENYPEFTTQDGSECPSCCVEEPPRVEDLQPADVVEDPRRQISLLPKSLVR